MLLREILKEPAFIDFTNGQSSHFYRLFVAKNELNSPEPSIKEIFERSIRNIKWKDVPSILILQMPRYGKKSLFDRITSDSELDVTDVIENGTSKYIISNILCIVDLYLIMFHWNLRTIFMKVNLGSLTILSLDSNPHRPGSEKIERKKMSLFAVLCIEISHYVAFVKSGHKEGSEWCFFDSMAHRERNKRGKLFNYCNKIIGKSTPELKSVFHNHLSICVIVGGPEENIPEVSAVPEVNRFLSNKPYNKDDSQVKRLKRDILMAFYRLEN